MVPVCTYSLWNATLHLLQVDYVIATVSVNPHVYRVTCTHTDGGHSSFSYISISSQVPLSSVPLVPCVLSLPVLRPPSPLCPVSLRPPSPLCPVSLRPSSRLCPVSLSVLSNSSIYLKFPLLPVFSFFSFSLSVKSLSITDRPLIQADLCFLFLLVNGHLKRTHWFGPRYLCQNTECQNLLCTLLGVCK